MDLLDIKKEIADLYDISVSDIDGRGRKQPFAIARQLAYFYSRRFLGYTYEKIGGLFDRNHAAVHLGIQRVEGLIETDPEVQCVVTTLEQKFPQLKEVK